MLFLEFLFKSLCKLASD